MKAVRLCTLMMLAVLATSLFAMPAEAQTSYPVECGQQVARVSRLQVEVEDTYKSFSANSFFIQKYDTTYKTLSFVNGYTFTGAKAISYYSGSYHGVSGHITLYKCQYNTY